MKTFAKLCIFALQEKRCNIITLVYFKPIGGV
jgi:hypothetical protein